MVPTNEVRAVLHRALEILEPIAGESGDVLYSGHDTLAPGRLYVLGLNPGGDPDEEKEHGSVIWRSLVQTRCDWNAYTGAPWGKSGPTPMQRRVRNLLEQLAAETVAQGGLALPAEEIFTTNAVFVRSASAEKLTGRWNLWWRFGWPVHQLFLRTVRPRVILCLGSGPDSAFAMLGMPYWHPPRRPYPPLWPPQEIESDPHRPGLVVQKVEFDLGEGHRHTCAVAALQHPSWFPGDYDSERVRPFLTQIARIIVRDA